MSRILLVDDQPPHASHHRRLFGDAVDVCCDYNELIKAVVSGKDWSAAFIDFDLSGISEEPRRTGLSALRILKQQRPNTRRIAYTTLSDNGRILYAAAARHWLSTEVILDKSSDDQALRDAVNPQAANPTPSAWLQKLKRAQLIDYLFARDNWLPLWRIWSTYNGSIKVVNDHLPRGNTPTSVREFSEQATDAMANFKAQFYGQTSMSYTRGNHALATPLVAFIDANTKFFHAPDLQETLDLAKPWQRSRTPR
jgi:CheY-like chemotaxis protein